MLIYHQNCSYQNTNAMEIKHWKKIEFNIKVEAWEKIHKLSSWNPKGGAITINKVINFMSRDKYRKFFSIQIFIHAIKAS